MDKSIFYFLNNKCGVLTSFFLILSLGTALAQDVQVKGWVKDNQNEFLPGVTIREEGTKNGALTQDNGTFSLKVKKDATLEFSFIGYQTKEVSLKDAKADKEGIYHVNIILELSADTKLNQAVVVGFGTQKKASMVSSIATIDPKELKGPTSNLTTMMAGKIPGMISFQRSGEPGRGTDNASFYIRGLSTFGTGKQNPLILIDGVESSPTDMARLQPDDIAKFSVLKDAAAAAVYGARGANGVLLITTRTGDPGKTKFNFRAETRISSNTRNFNLADNITYMKLANEAAITRSPLARKPYTQNKINHTEAGDDPYLYPNNNWIDQLIKKYTVNQAYNLNISGGSKKFRYYVAGTYNLDNGVLKMNPINNFNNNIRLANYSLRVNINLDLTKTTELAIKTYGQFDDYKGPIGGGAATFNNVIWSNPVRFPAVYPSSKLPFIHHPLFGSHKVVSPDGLTNNLYVNPYAEMVRGYSVYKTSNVQPQLDIKQNFDFITKGLNLNVMGYLRRYSFYSVDRGYNPFYYNAIIDPLTHQYSLNALNDGSSTSIGTVGTEYLGYDEGDKDVNSRYWLQGTLNYQRTFGKHEVGGSLISYISNYETGNAGSVQASLPQRNQGVSGRFTYAYDNRYLFEFDFGYNGSERFAKSHRYGFFPSVGIGYRISNEKFFEPLKKVISNLKLRATYGEAGNDQIGNIDDRFFYLSNVNLNDDGFGASFGRNLGVPAYHRSGVSISRYANSNITWEISKSLNVGMDLTLLNDLSITLDVYHQKRTQILQPKSSVESAAGFSATPYSNYGKAESKGIDLVTKYQHAFANGLWMNARATFTYATSEVDVIDEIDYPADIAYKSKKGHSINQTWGLIADRLFIDSKEVSNSPLQYGDNGLLAGDIKYKDVNGDGVVNDDDMVPIGFPTQPEIIYGFGSSFGYKGFDFSFYFQGSARSSFFINPEAIQPFFINGGHQNNLLQVIADSHWSETNQDLYAFWPRLSTWRVNSNNKTSTWWMRNGNFLRLKTVEFGYTFNQLERFKINSLRIYASGMNLFVLSPFKLWDPEMGGDGLGYPIQSVYSLGVQLNF